MQIVTPHHIAAYASCPRKCMYNWNRSIPLDSPDQQLIESVIQSAYSHIAKKNELVSWKKLSGWTTRCITNISTSAEYKWSKGILSKVRQWYDSYYLEEYSDPGVPNFPSQLLLDTNLVFKDTIPIVTMGSKLRLWDFIESSNYTYSKLYDDMQAQIRIWCFWKATGTFPEEYDRLVISPQKIGITKLSITEKIMNRIEPVIKHIVRGIYNNCFYPSVSEQCNNCIYVEFCHL